MATGQTSTAVNDWQTVDPGDWQTVGGTTNASEQSFGAALREYGRKMNPVSMAEGVAQTIAHPIDAAKGWLAQNEKIAQDAEAAYKQGDYKGALRHGLNYLLNAVPGLGASLEEAGNKLDSGDIAGGLADTAALATQTAAGIKGPAMVRATREAAPAVMTGAKGAITGGAKAAVDVRNVTGAGAAEWAAQQMGLPKGTGAVIAGAPKVIKGAVEGARAALDARLARMTEATSRPAPVAPFQEQPRALLDQGSIRMPPPEDASAVRTVNPDSYTVRDPKTGQTVEVYTGTGKPVAPAPAPETAAASAPEDRLLLDGLAQGFGRKSFDKLSASEQTTVRTLAARIQAAEAPKPAAPQPQSAPVAAQPAAAPPQAGFQPVMRPALPPEAAPATAAPVAAQPPAVAVPETMPPAVEPPAKPARVRAVPPTAPPTAPPTPQPAGGTPAPGNGMGGMKQYSGDYNPAALSDEEIAALNKPQPAAQTTATPETPEAWQPKPNGGGRMSRSTMQEVNDFQGRARSRKADQLAKFLYNAGGQVEAGQGISSTEASQMTGKQWQLAAKGARINEPSPTTIRLALQRLKQMEAQQPAQ